MKNTGKNRNRERRTKPRREAVSMQVKVSRDIFEHVRHLEARYGVKRDDIFLMGTVEYGSGHLPAQLSGGNTQMNFQYLTDVHSGRNAQRVQNDIQRRTIFQIGHIFRRKNAGNDALVTVTACHLVADSDLSLLRDIQADNLVDSRRQFVAVLAGEHAYVNNDAGFAVGHTQGSVADFSGLSPKMARSRRSSAVSSVSPLGVTLPTRMSPARISVPFLIIPSAVRSFRASSPTLGISRVISSGPSLVSRAS